MANFAALTNHIKERMMVPPGLPRPGPTISAWQEPVHPTVSAAQSTTLASETDIVIIGSGVTGCGAAHTVLHSKEAAGQRVTVLEARETCSGATGRNGGHLVSNIVQMVPFHLKEHGKHNAATIAGFSAANISRLHEIANGLNDKDRDAAELRVVKERVGMTDNALFEQAVQATKAAGDLPSNSIRHNIFTDRKLIQDSQFHDNVAGMIEQECGGALWPYRLITAVFESLLHDFPDRFQLETHTPVESISYDPTTEKYTLSTPRGAIVAANVIHCTNGHVAHLLPNLRGKLYPIRGTMSVQKPGPAFPRLGDHISWSHHSQPLIDLDSGTLTLGLYYLQQNATTGEIWVGGEVTTVEDLITADDRAVGAIAGKNLGAILPSILRDVEPFEVRRIWSGIMGFTGDGMPLVGQVPASLSGREGKREWISAGYNGHGMDKAWLCGAAAAKMAIGEDLTGFPEPYRITEKRLETLHVDGTADSFLGHF
ncbi:FAD dependent oxidoreductase [Myriangium duriaei CBS 260.36]|uniref:FAD dependent oxidoreductase n=1 Tax=Myriangium duriaei CBS 260.36 TaxID=1168546 RepID=A0A9P4J1R0_9PEZI|nr:FAD dependent oxidoreductase [Myriangium duriaei CBS 260.36]